MNRNIIPSISRTDVIWCAILLVLCAIFLFITLGLGNGIRMDVPFTYDGDGLEYNLLTKTMMETGWWLENPMTGAPGTLEMYDYAIGSNLDMLVMKIISIFSGNYAVVMNTYYILGFFLTAICSLYVFRQFHLSYPVATFGSVIYSFLFYHFFRIGHFNLTAYYIIPLIILVILWVCQGEPLFIRKPDSGKKNLSISLGITHKGILAIVFLFLISTHSYYGFFAALFLGIATLWSASRNYDVTLLINGAISGIVLIVFALFNKFPSLLYGLSHGSSFLMKYRYPYETEIYGLKLIQLVLPAPGHNISFLADIALKYSENRPLVNENVSASLGIICTLGLMFLLCWIFLREGDLFRKNLGARYPILDSLSLLTISAILIGTIGGFSAIIAQVLPEIHSYNRISLFIAFFAILAIGFLLQAVYEKNRSQAFFCPVFCILLLVITIFGVYDQVPGSYAFSSGSDREQEFLSQENYFSQIEKNMSPGSSILIIPDIGGFPNSFPPGEIKGLDSLKPYLHTTGLKWSYPTMKGRFWDNWQCIVSALEPRDTLIHLFNAGFSGLLIDTYGYSDGGKSVIQVYTNITKLTPFLSDDGRYAFYDLTSFFNQKKEGMSLAQYEQVKQNYIQLMKSKTDLQNPLYADDLRNETIYKNRENIEEIRKKFLS